MGIDTYLINMSGRFLLLPSMLCLLVLAGCAEKMDSTPAGPPELPAAFSATGHYEPAGKWWLVFNDPDLNRLIEEALEDNFSLLSAWERLSQAKALYAKSRSGLFPALDGEMDAGHTIDHRDGETTKSDTLLLGLSASYEVDLWGGIASEVDAYRLDMEASAADLDTAAMTLSAELATAWYRLVRQNAELGLLDEQIKANSKILEIINLQFRTGQVAVADVLQQRQLIESKESEKVLLIAEKGRTENQLAVLLGKVPGAALPVVPPEQLKGLPPLPSTGIPAEIIGARPDIRSAFLALQAADKRTANAVADLYPSLRLTASIESVKDSTGNLLEDFLTSLAAGLTGPIFDAGARRAEVERTRSAAGEKLHDYGLAVITAVGEVEDALLTEKQQQRYMVSLSVQLDLAERTVEEVKQRYLNGSESYERVLSVLTSRQSLQQTILSAREDLLGNRIELCRALGGGWSYSRTTAGLNALQ